MLRKSPFIRTTAILMLMMAGCGSGPSTQHPDLPGGAGPGQGQLSGGTGPGQGSRPEITLVPDHLPGGAENVPGQREQPRITPDPAHLPQRTPGSQDLPTGPGGRPTPQLPEQLRTAISITPPSVTIQPGSPISNYDAAQMISTFAAEYLGLNVTVTHAGGGSGDIALPSMAQSGHSASVSLAGQIAGGTISAGEQRGAAQVAVGSGTISGDLDADISGASEGAYSLIVRAPPPDSAEAALSLIRSTYPALAAINLQQQSSGQGGFVFYATTTHEGIDWQTKQLTTVAEAVLAGTTRQGRITVIWVVIGNGIFAASIRP